MTARETAVEVAEPRARQRPLQVPSGRQAGWRKLYLGHAVGQHGLPGRRALVGRRPWSDLVIWLAPVVIGLGVWVLPEHRLEEAAAACAALLLLAWGVRRPGQALLALIAFLPLQSFGFGLLYHLHVPGSLLRPAGAFKDLMGLAIILSAVHNIRVQGRRLDVLDKLALAYVGVVTAYLLAPHFFVPTAPALLTARLLAWRLDAGYVLLFFALRHAPIQPSTWRHLVAVLLGIGALVAAFAAYQFVSPAGFRHFILYTDSQIAFQQNVMGGTPYEIQQNFFYIITSTKPLRLSSIILSPFNMADYMVIISAVIVDRLVRGYRHWVLFALLAAVLFSIYETHVRADDLGVAVMVLAALVPTPKRPTLARLKVIFATVLGVVLIVPSLGSSRLLGGGNALASDQGHIREFLYGMSILFTYPLGLGLGDNPATGNRYILPNHQTFISDNSILQVADELGLVALAAWLAFVVAVFVALRRNAAGGGSWAGLGVLALVGVLVTGLYHHVFLTFTTDWTLWPLVGLALNPSASPAARERASRLAPVPERRVAGVLRVPAVPVGTLADPGGWR